MVLINSVFAQVATTVPGMTFVPTWDLFANSKGQFEVAARVNNVPSLLREPDGIHVSYVGENVISTYVTRAIGNVYHVADNPRVGDVHRSLNASGHVRQVPDQQRRVPRTADADQQLSATATRRGRVASNDESDSRGSGTRPRRRRTLRRSRSLGPRRGRRMDHLKREHEPTRSATG